MGGDGGADPVFSLLPVERASSLGAQRSQALERDGVSLGWRGAGGRRGDLSLPTLAHAFPGLLQLGPLGCCVRLVGVVGEGLGALLSWVVVEEFNDKGLLRVSLNQAGRGVGLWRRAGQGLLGVRGGEGAWRGGSLEWLRQLGLNWRLNLIPIDNMVLRFTVSAIFMVVAL